MAIPTSEDCPFNRVPLEIAFNIIEHLNLNTRKNLAFTCRKSYETLMALPESKRCIVYENHVKWAKDALFRSRTNGSLICTPQTKFKLVQKLNIHRVDINRVAMGKYAIEDFFKFLNENQSCIEITRMLIWDQLNEMEMKWLDVNADMIKDIIIKKDIRAQYSSEEKLSYKKLVEMIIKRHLSHRSIELPYIVEIESIATILQQWVRGERPNFERFECGLTIVGIAYHREILEGGNFYNWETLEGMARVMVLGLEDYVGEITNRRTDANPDIVFKVTVPGIGVMEALLNRESFEMYLLK